MEAFIYFFDDLSAGYKLGWIFGCLIFVWLLESIVPLVHLDYKKIKHVGTNFVFLSFILVLNLLIGIATAGVFYWIEVSQFGLLNWIEGSFWIEVLLAVAALDFIAQNIAHRILHKVAWMWKFHMIHHSDTKVDATSRNKTSPR